MGVKMKPLRSFSRVEPHKLGVGLFVGCFVALIVYISMSDPVVIPFLDGDSRLTSMYRVPKSTMVEDKMSSPESGLGKARQKHKPSCSSSDPRSNICKKNDVMRMQSNSLSTKSDAPSGRKDASNIQQLGSENRVEYRHERNGDSKVPVKNSSPAIGDPMHKEDIINPKQFGGRRENVEPPKKPICDFSDPRSDVCESDGDVRIHGKSSTVMFVTSDQASNPESNRSWKIKAYARKGDRTIMAEIEELSVKVSNGLEAPQCTVHHSIPAIVFFNGGYNGNYYHDFNDVLIPLFITARQFDGEVQFLIKHMQLWWINKYGLILNKLSRYELIDFDNDDRVHCYQHAIVGLHSHKDFSIDPSRAPNGYSMADFSEFLRSAYSLKRDLPIQIGEHPGKKPRLLVISRGLTRKFANLEEIVQKATELGYEVVVAEARFDSNVAQHAQIVNSCDVMMGVHGAGLTNLIFLPTNAVVIQIVPYGGFEGIAKIDYGDPSKDRKLRYLEYSITAEESTLIDLYPKDDPVIRDPMSLHKHGWTVIGEIYLYKQNVRLDMERFRSVLLKALELLHQ
ncbi:beta-1,2-xylosyltransferase XYXT1 [Elaeis guineensis]|uniref:Beta-1,2-xylosyltransferase XYXT1 n=1 Tax=Elaeis guineensis var. tenera TaxID=51953 RepID=A0A6I9QWA5_ELAGV|nr:beta-1,2-xylosyltransferase XYXT1 [Elaeis guineensis]